MTKKDHVFATKGKSLCVGHLKKCGVYCSRMWVRAGDWWIETGTKLRAPGEYQEWGSGGTRKLECLRDVLLQDTSNWARRSILWILYKQHGECGVLLPSDGGWVDMMTRWVWRWNISTSVADQMTNRLWQSLNVYFAFIWGPVPLSNPLSKNLGKSTIMK